MLKMILMALVFIVYVGPTLAVSGQDIADLNGIDNINKLNEESLNKLDEKLNDSITDKNPKNLSGGIDLSEFDVNSENFGTGEFLNMEEGESLNYKTGNIKENIEQIKNAQGDEIKKQSARLIEAFEEEKQNYIDTIYQSSVINHLTDLDSARERLENMMDQYKDISSELDKVENRKDRVDDKYQEVIESIKSIMKDLRATQSDLQDRIEKIRTYTDMVYKFEGHIKELKNSMENTQDAFSKYTQFLYKMNNDFYNGENQVDDIKLLLKSDDIADTLSHEDVMEALSRKLTNLYDKLEDDKSKFQRYNKRLNEMRVKYRDEVREYKQQLDYMEEQRESLISLFKFLREDKNYLNTELESMLNQQEEKKDQIQSLLNQDYRNMTTIQEMGAGKKIDFRPLIKSNEKSDGDKFISWPVLPPNGPELSASFEDDGYKDRFGAEHMAIDIKTPQGSDVYAPANGVVYKVVDNESVGVNWLIIVHKHGYVSVILHMYEIHVEAGEYVKRGQPIGLSGGKPGTRGAGYLSTGPHIHFEVFKNGKYIDPLSVMDLSLFKNRDQLPEKNQIKYFKDKFSRDYDLSGVNYMSGETIKERRKELVSIYGLGAFGDIGLWEDASDQSNIDIDLGICIGVAESGLGRNTTTKRNIGNVGNNDRGDRRPYPSPLSGARAIYATLNNRYLGDHYTVNNLSRYDNKDGSIYASNPTHWQENVVKCLTSLKGYRVPDDYPFRTYYSN